MIAICKILAYLRTFQKKKTILRVSGCVSKSRKNSYLKLYMYCIWQVIMWKDANLGICSAQCSWWPNLIRGNQSFLVLALLSSMWLQFMHFHTSIQWHQNLIDHLQTLKLSIFYYFHILLSNMALIL